MVYTDLDGTLLDHHNYSFAPAQPAISALARAHCPLLLNTSKTFAEVVQLRKQLDNHHPFITENGSTLCIPQGYFPWLDQAQTKRVADGDQQYVIQHLGPSVDTITKVLHQLRTEHGYQFTGFSDMSPEQVAECTELPLADATLAKQRQASEPMLWHDSEEALAQLKAQLQPFGLRILAGGRFLHVMGYVDKGSAIEWLTPHFQRKFPALTQYSVALGDSQNDLKMLETADIGVVIPDAKGGQLNPQGKRIEIAPAQGPKGWQVVMHQLINEILNSHSEKEFMHG
ncbi:HAD-IIB family hydrolase [Corallincola platygyrae]|uniref:HAD-IIB family hydrolase n=1 Tax=Corallincola platygyrae TaxID=1193278 RepID=A0ABW4XNV8_9GAMM